MHTINKRQEGFSLTEGLVVLAVVAILGLVGWYIFSHSRHGSNDAASGQNVAQKDITNSIDQQTYQQFSGLEGVSFWMPKTWTAASTGNAPGSLVSVLNYDSVSVEAELKTDGRYPAGFETGAEYYDVAVRTLKTYPYSLDGMYEVQIMFRTVLSNDPDEGKDGVTDVQRYKINSTPVIDYIQKSDNGFIDQRIVLVRNQDSSKEVRITLNPNQSRKKVTKENFDGLMQLVGSIKFTN